MKRLLFLSMTVVFFIIYTPYILSQFSCLPNHWQCDICTHRYEINPSVPAQFAPYIFQAAQAWNNTWCGYLEENSFLNENGTIYWGDLGATNCQNQTGHSASTEWTTIPTANGPRITYCTTVINSNSSIDWTTDSNPGESQMSFETVMIHEFGHWIGLCQIYIIVRQ